MADHLRKRIRAAVVASGVLGNLTTTETRVYASRVADMQSANLPGLRIYTPEEQIEPVSMGEGRIRHHSLTLIVEACVKSNTTPDDTVDQICKEVQMALDANQTLGGLCKWIELRSFEQQLDGESDKTICMGRMTFEVFYVTAQSAPDTPL